LKLLNYSLVGVLGAALASLATYQLLEGVARMKAPVTAPVMVREFLPTPTPAASADHSAAEWEELLRKNAELTAQLAKERASREIIDLTLKHTSEDLEELRRPMSGDLLSSSLHAELKSGEVVVTGGYKLADGTRLYAFIQPTVEQSNGADVVRVASKIMMLPDALSSKVGLDNLATNAANTIQHGEVWTADEQWSVFSAIGETPGVRGINVTGATVPTGTSSVIEAGELRLKVTPTVGADRESMDFEVRLEQAQPKAQPVELKPVPDAK